jgi:phenylpropionate dioxygenase-like ring-hydroxylating dioxygenase large terminal subunit
MVAEAALGKYWHPIARSEDVTDQPARFTLLSDFVVAFRDGDGTVAFKDMCVHRGAALSLGWIKDGTLTCPYHGWQFDRTGACVKIPSRSAEAPIPALAKAVAFQTKEQYGLVWVAMEQPALDVPPFPEDVFGADGWRDFLSYREVWRTSAARAVENFMDFSHFPYVHPNLLGTEDKAEVAPYKVTKTDDGLRYTFEQEEPSELYGKGGKQVVEYEYIIHMPFTIHLKKVERDSRATTIISMVASPLTERSTELYVWILRNHQLDAPDSQFSDFTNLIMEQDQVIVESQRPEGIPDSLKEELHLNPADAAALVYRQKLMTMAKVEPLGPYGA